MTSENELIRRAQSGDLEAFCLLARGYERRVFALALHYCRGREDAEDLSQEVWLKAFRSLAGFRFESSFYTWLRRIMVNTFLNDRRGATVVRDGERESVRLDSLEEFCAQMRIPGGMVGRAGDLMRNADFGLRIEKHQAFINPQSEIRIPQSRSRSRL